MLARIAGGVAVDRGAAGRAAVSLDRLFQADCEDGSLDQLMLAPMPLEQVVLVKAAAHWLTTGLPMTLVAPVLGVMLQLPRRGLPALVAGDGGWARRRSA